MAIGQDKRAMAVSGQAQSLRLNVRQHTEAIRTKEDNRPNDSVHCCHSPQRQFRCQQMEIDMSLGTILLIILILMLFGAIPAWPHSRGWGYGPSGGLGLVVVILVILLLLGRI